jgi:DNA-binding CsgD family transcriptional regulator
LRSAVNRRNSEDAALTIGEFLASLVTQPERAAGDFLRRATAIAHRNRGASGGDRDDADEAAAICWCRASAGDWSALRRRSTAVELDAVIFRFAANALREASRSRRRSQGAPRAFPEELPEIVSSQSPDHTPTRVPVGATRKQRQALRFIEAGETFESVADRLSVQPRSIRDRLARLALLARDPTRWKRWHQRIEAPEATPDVVSHLRPRQRELLALMSRSGATRRSVGAAMGLKPSSVHRMLSQLRRDVGDRRPP